MTRTRTRISVPEFRARKGVDPPLVMLTAYDTVSASVCEEAGVDAILVGDSLGNVLLGYDDTLPVTMDEMLHHARAVGRARRHALLIGDMPWMSYHLEPFEAVRNAARFVREARCDAVKLEGGISRVPAIQAILNAGIPVMGHLGLTPQSVLAMGGFKVQGRAEEDVRRLVQDAKAIVDAGVFSMVLEGLPGDLARRITAEVDVPTIGIGAGNACDGQVLVYHDLLGMSPGRSPKFVRRYAEIREQQIEAVRRFAGDVRERTFPGEPETYS